MKHLRPCSIMSVKQFESYRSLKLMSQKSVGKKLTLAKKKSNNLFISVAHLSNENNIAKSMSILKLCRIYLLNETLLVVVILTVSKWYRGEDRLSGKLHDFHVLRLSAEVGKASCLFFSLPQIGKATKIGKKEEKRKLKDIQYFWQYKNIECYYYNQQANLSCVTALKSCSQILTFSACET